MTLALAQAGMDVEAVRAHFQHAQGPGARQQSALAVRTRSGVAINIWRTYGASLHKGVCAGAWRRSWLARCRRTGSCRVPEAYGGARGNLLGSALPMHRLLQCAGGIRGRLRQHVG